MQWGRGEQVSGSLQIWQRGAFDLLPPHLLCAGHMGEATGTHRSFSPSLPRPGLISSTRSLFCHVIDPRNT
jgi:hypothetical protein